jgi:hypothetical protein
LTRLSLLAKVFAMSTVLLSLVLLIGLGMVTFFLSLGLTGLGVLVSWIFPVTPFQGTILHLVLFSLAVTLLALTFLCERMKDALWGVVEGEPIEEAVDVPERDDVNGASQGGNSVRRLAGKVGRNEPCPCGSGRKYKFCCSLKP